MDRDSTASQREQEDWGTDEELYADANRMQIAPKKPGSSQQDDGAEQNQENEEVATAEEQKDEKTEPNDPQVDGKDQDDTQGAEERPVEENPAEAVPENQPKAEEEQEDQQKTGEQPVEKKVADEPKVPEEEPEAVEEVEGVQEELETVAEQSESKQQSQSTCQEPEQQRASPNRPDGSQWADADFYREYYRRTHSHLLSPLENANRAGMQFPGSTPNRELSQASSPKVEPSPKDATPQYSREQTPKATTPQPDFFEPADAKDQDEHKWFERGGDQEGRPVNRYRERPKGRYLKDMLGEEEEDEPRNEVPPASGRDVLAASQDNERIEQSNRQRRRHGWYSQLELEVDRKEGEADCEGEINDPEKSLDLSAHDEYALFSPRRRSQSTPREYAERVVNECSPKRRGPYRDFQEYRDYRDYDAASSSYEDYYKKDREYRKDYLDYERRRQSRRGEYNRPMSTRRVTKNDRHHDRYESYARNSSYSKFHRDRRYRDVDDRLPERGHRHLRLRSNRYYDSDVDRYFYCHDDFYYYEIWSEPRSTEAEVKMKELEQVHIEKPFPLKELKAVDLTPAQVEDLVEDVKKDYRLHKNVFVDSEFPADHRSLSSSWKKMSFARAQRWSKFEWLRPDQFDKYPALFYGGAVYDDIIQGALGDCYFLCALSILAEREDLIEQILLEKKLNHAGCYGARFFKNGQATEVIIDDLVPVIQNKKGFRPAFSTARGGEMWVAFIEKAWAKLHGGYHHIERGDTGQALHELTGAPTEFVEITKKDKDGKKFWEALQEAQKKNWLMCVGTDQEPDVELEDIFGIVEEHAFAILKVQEYRGHQLLKLRNPWGRTEWNGDWSDTSHRWTRKALETLDPEGAEDGTFWMPLSDVLRLFKGVYICKVEPEYSVSSAKGSLNVTKGDSREPLCFSLTVKDDTPAYLSLYQQDKRIEGKDNYSSLTFRVISADDQKLVVATNLIQGKQSSPVECTLPKGVNYVIVEGVADHTETAKVEVVLSAYAAKSIKFDCVDWHTVVKPFCFDYYKHSTVTKGESHRNQYARLTGGDGISMKTWYSSEERVFCLYWKNNGAEDVLLKELVKLEMKNMEIMDQPGLKELRVELSWGQSKFVVIRAPSLQPTKLKYARRFAVSVLEQHRRGQI
mmetsp:Transcript_8619/g.16486  ORF Transcript_8619/g.16486 Transcript_8619/m.16486 type:complete len:1141 (-) Transcript_8619:44-3466(-)